MTPFSHGPFSGLSPLARGNLDEYESTLRKGGPIPARAGQPPTLFPRAAAPRAYPRSRGATARICSSELRRPGLSPLARGNPGRQAAQRRGDGPIPARAGQPPRGRVPRGRSRAYPRSRGATRCAPVPMHQHEGLSPLARGNRARGHSPAGPGGPIPARAGQPRSYRPISGAQGAYPRSRGATSIMSSVTTCWKGLSPLARGNHPRPDQHGLLVGPIPARAGHPGIQAHADGGRGPIPARAGQPLARNSMLYKRKTTNPSEILKSVFRRYRAPPDQPHAICFNQFARRITKIGNPHPADSIRIAPDHHQTALLFVPVPVAHHIPDTSANTGVHARRHEHVGRDLQHHRRQESVETVRYITDHHHHQRHFSPRFRSRPCATRP